MGLEDQREKNEGEKKDHGKVTAVFKMDFHCSDCTKKVVKFVRSLDGVEDVIGDCAANKLTVWGKVDPALIKERLEKKTNKMVKFVSLRPMKDGGTEEKKVEEKSTHEMKEDNTKEDDDQKTKEIRTAELKINLHCNDCIQKIRKTILRFKGVVEVDVYAAKDLVTVKGSMDVKELAPYLEEKLKRSVEVVLPKKEENGDKKGKETKGGDDKKDKEPADEGEGDEDQKKEKDASVQRCFHSMVVSKIRLHFDNCIPEIRKIVLKFMLKLIFNVLFHYIFSGYVPAWLLVE